MALGAYSTVLTTDVDSEEQVLQITNSQPTIIIDPCDAGASLRVDQANASNCTVRARCIDATGGLQVIVQRADDAVASTTHFVAKLQSTTSQGLDPAGDNAGWANDTRGFD